MKWKIKSWIITINISKLLEILFILIAIVFLINFKVQNGKIFQFEKL